jgi:dihydroxyacid dehydratase/phosphogluconate dehydratase
MAALTEALGMSLPGASSIPAVDSNQIRLAMDSARRIVEMVWEDLKPQSILTASSFRNAITVDMAIGGSTNAIIHLLALARRLGIELSLKSFDEISQRVPVLGTLGLRVVRACRNGACCRFRKNCCTVVFAIWSVSQTLV